jgi:predicted MFS family arabinose efflux permease
MESKRLIYLGILLGGAAGGYLPTLWGAEYFSFQTIIGNAVGAILGIWIAFKLTH